MLGIVLILAWKVGGWYGLDRFLLPIIGTPWTQRGEQAPPVRPQSAPSV